jgi:hypothetical protein
MHPPTERPSQLGDMPSAIRWPSPQAERLPGRVRGFSAERLFVPLGDPHPDTARPIRRLAGSSASTSRSATKPGQGCLVRYGDESESSRPMLGSPPGSPVFGGRQGRRCGAGETQRRRSRTPTLRHPRGARLRGLRTARKRTGHRDTAHTINWYVHTMCSVGCMMALWMPSAPR